MTTLDPGPAGDARCERVGDRWQLVFVRTLQHPPEAVWAALTDPAEVREWAPYDADRNLSSVGEATLTMVDREVREPMPATVRIADAPKVLEYTWGDDVIRWELELVDAGTELTLRHTTGDPDIVPKVAAGWHLCVVVMERLLDGNPVGPIRGRDAFDHGWEDLRAAYADRLDIDD